MTLLVKKLKNLWAESLDTSIILDPRCNIVAIEFPSFSVAVFLLHVSPNQVFFSHEAIIFLLSSIFFACFHVITVVVKIFVII
jgi:hypothetical protein